MIIAFVLETAVGLCVAVATSVVIAPVMFKYLHRITWRELWDVVKATDLRG